MKIIAAENGLSRVDLLRLDRWKRILLFAAKQKSCLCNLTVFLVLSIGIIGAAGAQSADQAWAMAQNRLKKNVGFFADEIVSRFELPGDHGPVAGQYTTRIKGWRDGEPQRGLTRETDGSAIGMKMAPLNLSLAEHLANHPEELFSSPDAITLLAPQIIDGRAWSVLQVRSRLPRGNAPVDAKVWVDPDNGELLKAEAVIGKTPLPGVKEAHFTIWYMPDNAGCSLPRSVMVTYTISIFFHTGNVVFFQEFGKWGTR